MSAIKSKSYRAISRTINVFDALPNILLAEVYKKQIIRSIEFDKILKIVKKHSMDENFEDGRKYLNLNWYMRDNIARAIALGLHKCEPKKVLDIGSGPGYFLLVCKYFNHHVTGLDLPDNKLYDDMFDELEINRIVRPVKPYESLLDSDSRYDLITAYAATFCEHIPHKMNKKWGYGEWRFFLDDLGKNLNPNGKIFMRMNINNPRGLKAVNGYDIFQKPNNDFKCTIINRREVIIEFIKR